MVTDHSNKRFCLNLGEVALKLLDWHGDDNRDTRHAGTTYTRLLEQIDGKYMEHVCGIVSLLSQTRSLERADFAVTETQIQQLGDDIAAEDHFADFYGLAILSCSGYRQRSPKPVRY